ncbi:carboxypeptidase B-like [Centruroides sculpturatus]|uniref:carboxypeptidase B-like n=1 Tax=Centruroides sculpturatus TaxID=218467 RepID=UPI000C6D105D|nr:carboxypeptidase B-like [Centruroides sculpturatus]
MYSSVLNYPRVARTYLPLKYGMNPRLFLLLLGIPGIICQTNEANFTGHKLIGAFPSSEKEIDVLRELRNNSDVDVWNAPSALYEKVNLLLTPEIADEVEEKLKDNGIDFYVVTNNIQKWIDQEKATNTPDLFEQIQDVSRFDLQKYHRLDEINVYLDEFAKLNGHMASVITIGHSAQNNPIKGLKIGNPGNHNKPVIWIDAGIHSREWVAPATALFLIDHLWKKSSDSRVKKLLDTFDWYIIPVLNPDGYVHTWSGNRMWRKNRIVSGSRFFQTCYGVDPNRNFDADFGKAGTDSNPCSDIYPGSAAFSENESRAVRDAIMPMRNRVKAYFTVHAYSQLWMIPYGYKRGTTKDFLAQMTALQKAANAIVQKHGQWYRYGAIANTIYPASGSSTDWAYEKAGIKYSFALELRDKGQYGFLLPNSLIKPTAEETIEGIFAVAEHVIAEL